MNIALQKSPDQYKPANHQEGPSVALAYRNMSHHTHMRCFSRLCIARNTVARLAGDVLWRGWQAVLAAGALFTLSNFQVFLYWETATTLSPSISAF